MPEIKWTHGNRFSYNDEDERQFYGLVLQNFISALNGQFEIEALLFTGDNRTGWNISMGKIPANAKPVTPNELPFEIAFAMRAVMAYMFAQ